MPKDKVPQDYQTAVKWYTLAAEHGLDIAQDNLGVAYANGIGVIKDIVYAHMWWNIAAAQGNENSAKHRDTFARKMTPTQREKAEDLARQCVKKNYKGC